MPGRPRPLWAPSMTVRFASSMAAARAAESGTSGAEPASVETAMVLATSPAAWPPMPSATAKSGKRMTNESSLCVRTQPTSVREPQASEPVPLAVPEMRSTAIGEVGAVGLTGANGMVCEGAASSASRAVSSMWSISEVSPGPCSGCGPSPPPSPSAGVAAGASSGMSSSRGIADDSVAGSGSPTSRAPSLDERAAIASRASSSSGAPAPAGTGAEGPSAPSRTAGWPARPAGASGRSFMRGLVLASLLIGAPPL